MRLQQNSGANCAERPFNFLLRGAPVLTLRRFYHICAVVLITGSLAISPALAGGEAAGFLSAIEDVPLMAGLTEDEAAALDFDKPDGRLVEAYAYGDIARQDSADFYAAVMPELGWRKIGEQIYSREGETLRIYLSAEEKLLLVRFVLSPNSAQ